MKDHNCMLECSQRPRDVFLATGERFVDRYVIKKFNGNPPNDFVTWKD